MAQDYNFGDAWYEAAKANLTHVVGPNSPIHSISKEDATVLYSGGPPYIFTAKDMRTSSVLSLNSVLFIVSRAAHSLPSPLAKCVQTK